MQNSQSLTTVLFTNKDYKNLKIIKIIDGTSVDGPGLRTSIYFSGCSHHCPGCQNPQTWDIDFGNKVDIEEVLNTIIDNDFDVTFSGGDPLFQVEEVTLLAKKIKDIGKNIWCYTGYTYEQIATDSRLSQILPYIDVLVDGRFDLNLRDISLRFRGSANQRLIDVRKSRPEKIVIWED